MMTITQDGQPVYDIILDDSFHALSGFLRTYDPACRKKYCIVSDSKVASFYLDAIFSIMNKHTGNTDNIITFVFPEGEKSKQLATVEQLYRLLIGNNFHRSDCLIALGGGVTGDLTGFAAATFLRGIDFIQIPTSLLAAVDSSIGGKTGVDLDSYKNMVGAFHMPKLVLINTSVMDTLDGRQFVSGMGEVVKSALIKDAAFFQWLTDHRAEVESRKPEAMINMIENSDLIKKNVVEADPYETKGERALLNFGHTIGHALEKYMQFSFLHGECVLIGSLLAADISRKKGFLSEEEWEKIRDYMESFPLPDIPKDADVDAIISYTRNDKKAGADGLKFILLSGIGRALISREVTEEDMKESLEAYIKR